MRLIQPWKIQIGHQNIAHLVDLEKLKDEILQLHCLTHNDDSKPHVTSVEESPEVCRVRDLIITPLVTDFAREVFDFDMVGQEFTVDTFGKWFKAGQELTAHLHGGTGITTVFYPSATEAQLIAFDPRGNACRGYPREIRDNHFGNYTIHPEAGDLYIIPSYIQHCVTTVSEDMRLSLVSDYVFRQG